jgi:hypothetical protein
MCVADLVFEWSRVSSGSVFRASLRAYMDVSLIVILGGLTLGSATVGAFGIYLLLSRPYRKARNRLAILLGQLLVVVSALTSLESLRKLEQTFLVAHRSSTHYAAMYAYLLSLLSGGFFVLRAEFRWQRSSGLVVSTKTNRPVVAGAYRKLLTALGILALSLCFSAAYWVFRPKPVSVIFGGTSMLFACAAIIFLSRTVDRAKMRESRTVILVLAAGMFCMFGGLAWKLRNTDPALSSAWLATLAVPCLVALAAFYFMRPGADIGSNS